MNLLNFIWIKFKTNPDIWFFYGFLITLTLSVRKVILFYPINGQFNEYTGIYLYLSDIFLFFTLVSWGILLLYNKNGKLSINSTLPSPFEINVPRPPAPKDIGTFRASGTFLNQLLLFIPLALVIWSFTSIFWSQNETIALFRSFKLLEMYFLFFFIALRIVPHGTIINNKNSSNSLLNFFKIIVIIALFQSIMAILQFVLQHSVGLFWLKESIISPYLPGVAKIILGGEKFIRAYGLFPHPNILGGFLIFSIILTLLYRKMFRVEQIDICHSERSEIKLDLSPRPPLADKLGMTLFLATIIQIAALILTFSKSAILGLFIALFYLIYKGKDDLIPRKWLERAFIFLAIVFLVFLILKLDINSFFTQSWEERLFFLNVSRETFLSHPLLGVGMGQFVLNFPEFTGIQTWQFQPVHNVFLLVLNELGLVGLSLFVWFIWKLMRHLKSVPRGTLCGELSQTASVLFLAFIVIMLFDHYLWDIQPGQILFWLAAGLLAGARRYKL
ncbi:MAG: O-antigen ligase family protein [Candidatus Moranbacteria bacterium]|nr:O-antigen ligase family protein [Candidatus Moranbacteria bacterium]